jgi:hydrogenase/urease accessory protein HupE
MRTTELFRPSRSRFVKAAARLAAAFVLASPSAAAAHDPGLSALDVGIGGDRIVAALSLAAADVEIARHVGGALERFAAESIHLELDGAATTGAVVRIDDRGSAGATVTLAFERGSGRRASVRSDVPRRLARGHRQLLAVRSFDRVVVERMLDAGTTTIEFDLDGGFRSGAAARFFPLGLHHILGGYDHLLFLAALFLGVVNLRSVVSTVTAFTVAHSATLSLAVLGIVHVPAAIVEPLIAVSIVFVGVENLLRRQMDSRWKLTFVFGLVHGFGFAGALQDLGPGTTTTGIAAPLAWFNIGVEAGQLGVALLLWPLIGRLNASPRLRTRLVPACSAIVVAAGLYWMLERTLL